MNYGVVVRRVAAGVVAVVSGRVLVRRLAAVTVAVVAAPAVAEAPMVAVAWHGTRLGVSYPSLGLRFRFKVLQWRERVARLG